ncbi:MAG: glutathione S-transferase N-terminal domain-containing protein [Halomonas sp.]|nr:glutathione S-transferase N-terminal domain-containing protein [Halomonas sp.]
MTERSAEAQAEVERECRGLALYLTQSCPFCIKVRREMERLQLPIELRDVARHPDYRREQVEATGRGTVPCLRIADDEQDRWMYESDEIVRYLRRRFETSQ